MLHRTFIKWVVKYENVLIDKQTTKIWIVNINKEQTKELFLQIILYDNLQKKKNEQQRILGRVSAVASFVSYRYIRQSPNV